MTFPWETRPPANSNDELQRLLDNRTLAAAVAAQQRLQAAGLSSETAAVEAPVHSWELPFTNQYSTPQLAAPLLPPLWEQQAAANPLLFQQALLAQQQQAAILQQPSALMDSILLGQLQQQQQRNALLHRAEDNALLSAVAAVKESAEAEAQKQKLTAIAKEPKSRKSKSKKPLSAYNIFFKDKREEMLQQRVVETDPSKRRAGFSNMAKEIGAMWKSLDATTRAKYEQVAQEEKEAYMMQQQDAVLQDHDDDVASAALLLMGNGNEKNGKEESSRKAPPLVKNLDSFGKKLFTALVDKKNPSNPDEIQYDSQEEELLEDESKPSRSAPFLGRKRAAPPNDFMYQLSMQNHQDLSMLAQPEQMEAYPPMVLAAAAASANLEQEAPLSELQQKQDAEQAAALKAFVSKPPPETSLSNDEKHGTTSEDEKPAASIQDKKPAADTTSEDKKPAATISTGRKRATTNDQDQTGHKRRKGWKKPKDKPKRPLSAYNLFFRDEREKLLQFTDKKLGFGEMGRLVGSRWKELSEERRAAYNVKAEQEKLKYFQALLDWKHTKEMKEEAAMVMVSNLQTGWMRENGAALQQHQNALRLQQQQNALLQQQQRAFGAAAPVAPLFGQFVARSPAQKEEGEAIVSWNKPKEKPKRPPSPNIKPKRPLSAYNLFFREERANMINENQEGSLGFRQMAVTLGAKWKNLDADKRKVFEKEAYKEKLRYFQAMEDWKQVEEAQKAKQKSKQSVNEVPMSIRGGGYDTLDESLKKTTGVVLEIPISIRGGGYDTLDSSLSNTVGKEELLNTVNDDPNSGTQTNQVADKPQTTMSLPEAGDKKGMKSTSEAPPQESGSQIQTSSNQLEKLSEPLDGEPRKNDKGEKCSKCVKRWARRACSQMACLACCDDMACEGHKEIREKALLDNAILNGTSEVNRKAAAKRALAIVPGSFREPAFAYLGETAMLWSLRDYMANPKWRDDAVRRSKKRNQHDDRTATMDRQPCESRSKRFKRVMDGLYEKSMES